MDSSDSLAFVVDLVKDWAWWKATIAITIFIVAFRSPAIIGALTGYKKVIIDGEHQRRSLEAQMRERLESRQDKAARDVANQGGSEF